MSEEDIRVLREKVSALEEKEAFRAQETKDIAEQFRMILGVFNDIQRAVGKLHESVSMLTQVVRELNGDVESIEARLPKYLPSWGQWNCGQCGKKLAEPQVDCPACDHEGPHVQS